MNPRVKDAVLWGVVGFLTFLVLLQGYELLEDIRVDLVVKAGAAVVVFIATTVITYVANDRIGTPEARAANGDSPPVVETPDRATGSASDGSPDGGEQVDRDAEDEDRDAENEARDTADADEGTSDESEEQR